MIKTKKMFCLNMQILGKLAPPQHVLSCLQI